MQALNKDLRQSLNDSKTVIEESAKRAEGLINHLRAKLSGDVAEMQNGQSVSGLIVESAKNAVLVAAMLNNLSEEDCVRRLKDVMDANVEFQQRNVDLIERVKILTESNDALSKQVQGRDNEIANLTKALELTSQGGRRKKSRRAKINQAP
jgi:hypothetical protein